MPDAPLSQTVNHVIRPSAPVCIERFRSTSPWVESQYVLVNSSRLGRDGLCVGRAVSRPVLTDFRTEHQYQKYRVQILFYSVREDEAVIDLVTLEAIPLETYSMPTGSPCAVVIEIGAYRDALDDLLNRWAEADEVLEISYESRLDGGGCLVLESPSVMVVLRTDD